MPLISANRDGYCHVEDLIDALHLLTTTFHVGGAHLYCNSFALLWGDGSQALSFEQIDAGLLVAEVRLEAAEDDWSCRAEVKHFRVPL